MRIVESLCFVCGRIADPYHIRSNAPAHETFTLGLCDPCFWDRREAWIDRYRELGGTDDSI